MPTWTSNIPSQVKPYANVGAFPATGSVKTIYIAEDTDIAYYWTGSAYQAISIQDLSGLVPYTGATTDVDLGNNDLNAEGIKIKGTAGNGHLNLKHQSSDATAGGSESVIYADASGNPKWKNDGNAVQAVMLENSAITGATKTKITYDSKGLVTAGADATTADIADSTNKRYVTDAQLTVLGNTSGTNTGDQDLSGLVAKSDYTPAHSLLAQQSGTGSPTSVSIGTNEILGRLSGGGANIKGLSTSEVKTLLDLAGTNTGDQTLSGLGGVPTSRSITINGTTQDLSADRTFSAINLNGQPNGVNTGTSGALRYFGFSDNGVATAETWRRTFIPNACTLKNFYVRTSGSQPASGSHVLTILKNGVATSIVVTIAAGSAAGVFSDTTNSVSFAAGDEISIQAVNNATAISSTILSFSIGNL